MESSSSNESSLFSRVKLWFDAIPFNTRLVFVVCVVLYLAELLLGWDPTFSVCLHIPSVVQNLQLYRIFTSALFHAGALHLAFNMLAFIPIGSDMERRIGTVKSLHLIILFILLLGILHIALTSLLTSTKLINVNSCSIGFSGVIFGLIVMYTQLANIQQFSVFGLFPVPAKIYPWALLVLWQLLIPGLSFLGHLSGILVGQMNVWGWLQFLHPSENTVTLFERSLFCCHHTQSFILLSNTNNDILPTHNSLTTTRGESRDQWWSTFYRRVTSFGRSERSDTRFPGEAKYLTEDEARGQNTTAAIPVITESQDPNEDFNRLLEMGFDAPSVRAALLTSDGDFTIAMNKLTGQS